VDQAALHGIITRLEDLGVELIALQPYPGRPAATT
jgi:hypothetical protein